MIKLLILLFVFVCSPEKSREEVAQSSINIEMIIEDDGTFIVGFSDSLIETIWMPTLVRGCHEIAHLPFDKTLFDKHYTRVIRLQNGQRNIVEALTDFRTHQESDTNIKRAFDVPKNKPLDIAQMVIDVQKSFVFDSLKMDEIENVLEHKRWSWGSEEIKLFTPLRFTDMTQAKWDSIRLDSVKWKMMPVVDLIDSLGYKDVTIDELDKNAGISSQTKSWFRNELTKSGRTYLQGKNMTMTQVFNLKGEMNRTWLKNPVIAQGLKSEWLKRETK